MEPKEFDVPTNSFPEYSISLSKNIWTYLWSKEDMIIQRWTAGKKNEVLEKGINKKEKRKWKHWDKKNNNREYEEYEEY